MPFYATQFQLLEIQIFLPIPNDSFLQDGRGRLQSTRLERSHPKTETENRWKESAIFANSGGRQARGHAQMTSALGGGRG